MSKDFSNCIIVDYPPGGLGHFIAQVKLNLIDNHTYPLSFHSMYNLRYDYDIELIVDSKKKFLERLSQWEPKKTLSVCHSWGNAKLLKQTFNCQVWQVLVDQSLIYLHLNRLMKAAGWNDTIDKDLFDRFKSGFKSGTDAGIKRLWYFNSLKYLQLSPWRDADLVIKFDDFYKDQNSFAETISKINPNADIEAIYNAFLKSQTPIIDRVNRYTNVVEAIKQGDKIAIDDDFCLLDHSLLIWMLSTIYPNKDFTNMNSESWFSNTDQILDIIHDDAIMYN